VIFFVWYKDLDRSFFRFVTSTRLTDGGQTRRTAGTERQNSHRSVASAFNAAR